MKKSLPILMATLMTFALLACSTNGDDDDDGPSAPDMGSASDLPASGATSYPSTQTDTVELFQGAQEAIDVAMEDIAASSKNRLNKLSLKLNKRSSPRVAIIGSGRGTETETYPIDWTGEVGGGTMTVLGEESTKVTRPDVGDTFTVGKTYNNLVEVIFNLNLTGTIDTITCDDSAGNTYTISGKAVQDIETAMDMDVTFTDSDGNYTANVDASISLAVGYAYSIKRQDGLGAKFIVSFAFSNSAKDLDEDSDWEGFLADDFTVKVQVFNDDDEMVNEYEIPYTDVAGDSDDD